MIEREELLRALERAPALADRLASEAPFETVDDVILRARALLDEMTIGERIAVLNAHPRIGADPRSLSKDSRREQGTEDPAVASELARLNEEYERQYGFRFVVFVAGRGRAQIVPFLRERLGREREDELLTGTGEFLAITRDRLERART